MNDTKRPLAAANPGRQPSIVPNFDTSAAARAYCKEGARLTVDHFKLLTDSAISAEVSRDRGYRTEFKKTVLREKRLPALIGLFIPIFNARGDFSNCQLRPDEPRIDPRTSRPIKYETPAHAGTVIDVPRSLSRKRVSKNPDAFLPGEPIEHESPPPIMDVSIPLFITEGSRKADSGVSIGLCAIALMGVSAWHRLPDWNDIPIKNRLVHLCFDSDVIQKRPVWIQLRDLKRWLESHKARVDIIRLPPGAYSEKTGLDDFIAARKREGLSNEQTTDKLLSLANDELPPMPTTPTEEGVRRIGDYAETSSGMVRYKVENHGVEVSIPLANFTARILAYVTRDDGSGEPQRLVDIQAICKNIASRFTMSVAEFHRPGELRNALGGSAIVYPHQHEYLSTAIQTLSVEPSSRVEFAHTGWRQIDDKPAYLHGNGAITAQGLRTDVTVKLEGILGKLALPTPAAGPELEDAVAAVIEDILLLGLEAGAPIFAATFLAPLAEALGSERPDFTVWLIADSGWGKSEKTALGQACYGDFTRQSLPLNFECTPNLVEDTMFAAKDVLLVVDDYHPPQSRKEAEEMAGVAGRVCRSVGNLSGRGRMTRDIKRRPAKPPRCVAIASGEYLPAGVSNLARMFVVHLPHSPFGPRKLGFNSEALNRAQSRRHLYPAAMSAYVQRIAQRMDLLKEKLPGRFHALRNEERNSGGHARDPGQVAHLRLGLEQFLELAVDCGAITEDRCRKLLTDAINVLRAAVASHTDELADQSPTVQFARFLLDGLASRKLFLEGPNHTRLAGTEAARWGWELVESTKTEEGEFWRHPPNATLLGYVDKGLLYLLAGPAYQFAVQAARTSGHEFTIGDRLLCKRLTEAGVLLGEGEGKNKRNTISRGGISYLRLATDKFSALARGKESLQPEGLCRNGADKTSEDAHIERLYRADAGMNDDDAVKM